MQIGDKVRQARKARGFTLEQVARRVGVTQGAISQIELGRTNPSVATLKALADSLGITVGDLFNSNRAPRSLVVRPHERRVLASGDGIGYQLLTPDTTGRVEFILSEYEPGATTGDLRYSHPGEECGLVLQGRLEIQIGDEVYALKAGDSIRFDCSVPHRLTNIGRTVLRCVWAVSPPSF